MSDNINQLAATLRAAGLCGSMLDAKNMAASISSGVTQRHEEVESRIVKHMGTGQRDGGFEVIRERVGPQQPKPEIFEAPEQPKEEVFVNESSIGVEQSDTPLSDIMKEVDEVVESVQAEEEEPAVSIEEPISVEDPVEPAPEPEPTPEPEPQPQSQSSLSIFEDDKPADIVVQASQEKEIKAEVEPQRIEPGPSRQVYSGQPQQPQKRSFEVPVDRSKPRATLTEQEKKDSDISKWFYFGK